MRETKPAGRDERDGYNMLYTVIIPCYQSAATIRKVVEETMAQFNQMNRGAVEFVLVDDCSPDGGATVRELRSLVDDYPNVRAVELAKNAGQHNAQMAALNYAKGDFILSMDDDGQTSPTQLPKLLDFIVCLPSQAEAQVCPPSL